MKQKTCKVCKQLFTPYQMGQKVCSGECAISLAISERGKAEKVAKVREKRADKVKLDAMRTKPQLTKLAQTAFNSFVRARDAGKPCISCGAPLAHTAVGGAFDAELQICADTRLQTGGGGFGLGGQGCSRFRHQGLLCGAQSVRQNAGS